jgi:epoxyqueuosine reductase
MASESSLTAEVVSQAESYAGICAGIVRLEDVLKSPSYQDVPADPDGTTKLDGAGIFNWPPEAATVLVLGLYHPAEKPRLDWWERGDTWGNRRLREISGSLKQWLRDEHDLGAHPLPYHLEKGGLFLKDAAVLSGIGIIGRNNLLLHPEWGPRIRLRAVLLEGNLQPTKAIEGFSPCGACEGFCQKACPVKAFPQGTYSRAICRRQMNADADNEVPDGEIGENGRRYPVIKYCRACELSCPVGN